MANQMMLHELAQDIPLQCLDPHSMKPVDSIWSLCAVLLLKWPRLMVCHASTIQFTWDKCCEMLELCDILEMDGVQHLYYVIYLRLMVIYLKWMVCNACTMWYTWNGWCAKLVLCDILATNGVQCLYYVKYLTEMVCNPCNMWYTWDKWCAVLVLCDILELDGLQEMKCCTMWNTWKKWCAMLVLCDILETNGVQCLYYVIYLRQMVCHACTMW